MTPERWQDVKRIFDEALEREPAERPGFLETACHNDEELRAEVASLLEAQEEAGSRYDTPIVASGQPQDPVIGRHVGSYKVVRRLGSGGMGAVYLASRDDAQFRRLVAIKMIRPELLDENTRRRFNNERQTLAALEHPNIVKLVDGGTTEDGWPYLIMDYVEGQPIDRYVREHDLPTTERLELFRKLCAAVHYAHQNLVVHRDLKPANILVTPQGVPKLLDFGIAKLLRPAFAQATVGFTRTNAQPMTPEYASPEQILGNPITTASDIYSLGVLLYALLTGMHPYQMPSQSYHELEVSICEGNPKKPSVALQSLAPAAARQLRGDLDTIVLTAMRKEPQRRYSSAEHLAEDVRRHLHHEPLAARPDTVWYRTQKFIERNKLPVGAAAAAIVALLVLGIKDDIDHRRAEQEGRRAEQRFQDLRAFASWVIQNLDDAVKQGLTPARRELSAKAVEYLDGLAAEARNDTALKLDLIQGYLKVADIQGNLWTAHLGNEAAAKDSVAKAEHIAEGFGPEDRKNPAVGAAVAQVEQKLGDLLGPAGDRAGALAHYSKALEFLKHDPKGDPRPAYNVVVSMAEMQSDQGDPMAALETYRSLEPMVREFAAKNPKSAGAQRMLALVERNAAWFALLAGDASGTSAEAAARAAIAAIETAKPTPGVLRTDAVAYLRLAEIEKRTGKNEDGLQNCAHAIEMLEKLLSQDASNIELSENLAQAKVLLVQLLQQAGKREQARRETAAALAWLKPLVDRNSRDLYFLTDYVRLVDETPFAELRKGADAIGITRQAVEVSRDSETLDLLAQALENEGKIEEAKAAEQNAIALLPSWREGRPKPENRVSYEAALARMSAPPPKPSH